ncbi:hypothetical protein JTB14_030868, partial [Gonioctena quinquepunctata]
SLKRREPPNEQGVIQNRQNIFQEDNYQKASIKLRRAEETSDVATSDIDEILPLKRARKPNRRLFIDNDSSSESENEIGINSIKDFQKNILNILLKVKQQNQQILNILIEQKQDQDAPGLKLAPPTDLPVDLPLKTVTDVNRIEAYLANEKNLAALAAYCEILGGKDKVGKINTILRCLISNQVAAQYSFLGTRNQKLPFGTVNLRKVVISAVLSKFEGDTQEVDECIKVWLKHGPKRLSLENKKK